MTERVTIDVDPSIWDSWDCLHPRGAVLVFDGATLEGPQDAPRATHSHEQGEAVPKCQPGCAGRSEARRLGTCHQ